MPLVLADELLTDAVLVETIEMSEAFGEPALRIRAKGRTGRTVYLGRDEARKLAVQLYRHKPELAARIMTLLAEWRAS